MSNPFQTKFESQCAYCTDYCRENELMFAHDGEFICWSCAAEADVICPNDDCENYKKPNYPKCYGCFTEENQHHTSGDHGLVSGEAFMEDSAGVL